MSEAGRELDALVAEKIMGWTQVSNRGLGLRNDWSQPVQDVIPGYSTSMRAAWKVVENLRKRGLYLQMNDTMSAYRARFFTVESTAQWDRESADGAFYQFADTAPLAICRAALAALGVPS